MSTSTPSIVNENELIRRYHAHGDLNARAELIERLTPLVRHIARRYANRGEPLEDLVQVGMVGLIKAVDRFDPSRGFKLSTFAAPNVIGEIKRHFRDRGWAVRPPRDVQELTVKLSAVTERLTSQLHRPPTVAEIAEALKVTEEQALEAIQGSQSYSAVSFDEPAGEDRTALDVLGEDDKRFELVDVRLQLEHGLSALAPRDREIVRLRFFEELTQREIADRIGISQMHVSRLLRKALDTAREQMDANPLESAPRLRAVS